MDIIGSDSVSYRWRSIPVLNTGGHIFLKTIPQCSYDTQKLMPDYNANYYAQCRGRM